MYLYTIDGNELTSKETLDYGGEVSAVSYSPSGAYLAVSGGARKLFVYDTSSYDKVNTSRIVTHSNTAFSILCVYYIYIYIYIYIYCSVGNFCGSNFSWFGEFREFCFIFVAYILQSLAIQYFCG